MVNGPRAPQAVVIAQGAIIDERESHAPTPFDLPMQRGARMTGARSAASARQPLRRAGGDRMLLGVCAGIARTLDLSPLAVRLAAVVLAAVAAPLVLAAYVIAAAIVPRDDGRALLGGVPADRRETLLGWGLVGVVLVAFAVAEFRLEQLVWPALSSFGIFAAAAAALGLIAASQRRAAGGAPVVTPASPTPSPPAADADRSSDEGTAETATVPSGDGEPATATMPVPPPPVPPPPAPPRGPSLGTIAAGVLLIGGAAVFLLVAAGAIDPSATEVAVGLAVAAALAGAGAIAGAVTRRRGVIVLLALGTVLGLGAAGVGLASTELDDGVGARTERPATAAEIPGTYRLGVGTLDIDLRDTRLPAGVTTVGAYIAVGDLTVVVPRGVRVASVGPTTVDGVTRVNRALPAAERRPAGKRERKKARVRAAKAPQTTIRIDADVREGNADVVLGGP
jgi:phage shock protein PspC (stress-responsive transcriptional regulator)